VTTQLQLVIVIIIIIIIIIPESTAAGAWHCPPTPIYAEVKERVVIPPLPLWAFMAFSRVIFTFTFAKYKPWDEEDCGSQEKDGETGDIRRGGGEKVNEHVKSQITRSQNTFPPLQYNISPSIFSSTVIDSL
jgi:hypothetical protein